MNEKTELLPCPFCGADAHVSTHMDEDIWSHNTVPWTKVECGECEIGTPSRCAGWEPTAEEAWNARAASPSSKSTKEADDGEWVAQVVSSGPYNFPLLQWRSAEHSLNTAIGTKLYLASSSIKEDGDQAIYNSMAARYQRDRLKEDGERAEPCPRGDDKPEPTCTNRHQCWEPCGELGHSEEHVRVGREPERGNTICNPHPDAPHSFNRNRSLNEDRYVCDCEGWMPPPSPLGDTPEQQEQKR